MQTNDSMETIRYLCSLGARPSIILSFFRYVPIKIIRKIYKEVTGTAPLKGQLPIKIQIYFNRKHAVQASVLAKLYSDALESTQSEANALITAYELLKSIYGHSCLNFSQVWHISRYVACGQFTLKRCSEGHSFLYDETGLPRPPCPVCKEIRKVNAPAPVALDVKVKKRKSA